MHCHFNIRFPFKNLLIHVCMFSELNILINCDLNILVTARANVKNVNACIVLHFAEGVVLPNQPVFPLVVKPNKFVLCLRLEKRLLCSFSFPR